MSISQRVSTRCRHDSQITPSSSVRRQGYNCNSWKLEKQGKTSADGDDLHCENLSDPKIRARPVRDHTARELALTLRLLFAAGTPEKEWYITMPLQAKASIWWASLSDDRIKSCAGVCSVGFCCIWSHGDRSLVQRRPTNSSLVCSNVRVAWLSILQAFQLHPFRGR
jgi:hypothetical protein